MLPAAVLPKGTAIDWVESKSDCKVVEVAAHRIVDLEHVSLASTYPNCENREDSSLAQNSKMSKALWKSLVDASSAYPSSLAVPPQ